MKNQNILKILSQRFEHIVIACGKTDLRRGIDGLVALVQSEYKLDPYSSSMFLFCGSKLDRIKILIYDGESFAIIYKRLESGKYKWPRDNNEAKLLTEREFAWFCDGLSMEQPKAIKPIGKTNNY
jgi:transposase